MKQHLFVFCLFMLQISFVTLLLCSNMFIVFNNFGYESDRGIGRMGWGGGGVESEGG